GLLGIYFLLNDQKSPVVSSIGFLPILSLVLFIITYCWGLGPLPYAVMGELFSIEIKTVATPIATAFSWALSFLVTRYFEPVANAVGMYVVFWLFGVCCVSGFIFTLFLVPETKGKSLQEIQYMLAGRMGTLYQVLCESNMKILGIPEIKSENLVNIITLVAKSADHELLVEDILHVTRIEKLNTETD
ncbi:unnamed protein product, partial [Parnassius apollo]